MISSTTDMIGKEIHTPRGPVRYWTNHIVSDDTPLIFLHGLTADHTLFDKQTDYFKSRHKLIVWDSPGHGQSRPYSEMTYPNAAEDLKEILDREGIDRAVLIGQSMGGYVIQSFLTKYPERALGFVGIDTCPFGRSYYSDSDLWWIRQMGWTTRTYPREMLISSISRSVSLREDTRRNMRTALERYSKDELCDLLDRGYGQFYIENEGLREDLKIECPLLIIYGDSDVTGKVRQYSREWARRTGAPSVEIPGAAHNSNMDNAPAVNYAIDRFLRSIK